MKLVIRNKDRLEMDLRYVTMVELIIFVMCYKLGVRGNVKEGFRDVCNLEFELLGGFFFG